MIKKRMIGTIVVKNGQAVQSFGYQNYLPIGKPRCLAENLDRWGVDEIIILSIDRSKYNLGPDLNTLKEIANEGIKTPLIYGGGIFNSEGFTGRRDKDGQKIFKAHLFNKKGFGTSNLCPFDCNCCYI